ncbi:MAG: exopolysaccharide biosynthesis polyprenyl glycosylphosphotransferase [Anaerolineales bacterium]|nr:exopolysaccharide biosynthesis polyprenyl glycosylphosphotransferase [Anaerolineales bacterium]
MSSQEIQPALDKKAARMLEIYANEQFKSPRNIQRLRVQLIVWVLRNKVLGNLKRMSDLVLGSVALILLSPVMAITALLIKLDSPGPVIFRQERVGAFGRPFTCYKFRSMTVDAEARKVDLLALNEADAVVFKMANDPRVTRVGRIIRKYSIDELPQFWNVLRGDMSLVGPRPPVPYEVSQYDFYQLGRLGAVPGITGLQQVSGRSDLAFKRWVELDLQYIAEQSFWKDIEILLKTLPAVILARGAR